MGFASSPATRNALASHGVRVTGWTWRWGLGLKGGTFPPHRDINGEHKPTADSFAALPGEDVNGDSCMCNLVPVYRTADGRFAKPGLRPVFQPPVTASLVPCVHEPEPLDFTPLVAAMRDAPPIYVNVAIPDGAIVVKVNVPELRLPSFPEFPTIPAPVVNVTSPDVTVHPPNVDVHPPTINVAAPNVKVEPKIDVKPVVKVIREKILGKRVRFQRGADGKIDTAEVSE